MTTHHALLSCGKTRAAPGLVPFFSSTDKSGHEISLRPPGAQAYQLECFPEKKRAVGGGGAIRGLESVEARGNALEKRITFAYLLTRLGVNKKIIALKDAGVAALVFLGDLSLQANAPLAPVRMEEWEAVINGITAQIPTSGTTEGGHNINFSFDGPLSGYTYRLSVTVVTSILHTVDTQLVLQRSFANMLDSMVPGRNDMARMSFKLQTTTHTHSNLGTGIMAAQVIPH